MTFGGDNWRVCVRYGTRAAVGRVDFDGECSVFGAKKVWR